RAEYGGDDFPAQRRVLEPEDVAMIGVRFCLPQRRASETFELQCAGLRYSVTFSRGDSGRARLWQADIEAVGKALTVGLIEPEQALELLAVCDCLQLIAPKEPAA